MTSLDYAHREGLPSLSLASLTLTCRDQSLPWVLASGLSLFMRACMNVRMAHQYPTSLQSASQSSTPAHVRQFDTRYQGVALYLHSGGCTSGSLSALRSAGSMGRAQRSSCTSHSGRRMHSLGSGWRATAEEGEGTCKVNTISM
jgi:hypothetical protein